MSKAKPRSALGTNPLSQGIFSKTVSPETPATDDFKNQESSNQTLQDQESSLLKIESIEESQATPEPIKLAPGHDSPISSSSKKSRKQNQEKIINKKESVIKQSEPSFLNEALVERVNLRLSVEMNDWLDSLLKQGKRTHGRKIPKETWVQAALEIFRALPIDWQAIDSEESLRAALLEVESRLKTQD
ncbi:hypothetical protein IQ268_28635 [Oculatella sp. LEGE 06141]|uniref:hypothetical protein n=1 Tax=Oculatella sp. LEGE 06141 TaxID=1828648 RepID=UPI00187F42B5|nr:hypothetical protein [Oculatella sp. LEGE 06141]MBE9182522.1 hypothetical protein [Oculatella sp. LEGE 06141]